MTEQETKQNNRTDVNPDERTAEIEEASVAQTLVFEPEKRPSSPNGRLMESENTDESD